MDATAADPARAASRRGSRAQLRRLVALAAAELPTVALVTAIVAVLAISRRLVPVGFGESVITPARYGYEVAVDFVPHFATAMLLLVVLQAVRRLAPPGGSRRTVVLAVAVVLASVAAALGVLVVSDALGMPTEPGPLLFLHRCIPAALLVAVAEFHRNESLALARMRAAEADRATLEHQTLEARVKTLEAQIEPHFLFNVLANLRRLYETDPGAGERMLDRLTSYFQTALPTLRDEPPTLDREVRLVEAYLELQQVRMGRRLFFRIDVAPALRSLEVPPLMLLTLVENAVKHGIAPQREGGRVEVSARLDDSELHLHVADDGHGFGGDSSGDGTGLANIRTRLAATFGTAAELSLTPRAPRGVVAALRMPAAP